MAKDKKQNFSSLDQQEKSVQKSSKQTSKKNPLTAVFNTLFQKNMKQTPAEGGKEKGSDEKKILVKTKAGAEKSTEGKKPQSSADQKAKQQTKQQILDKAKVGAEKSTEGKKPQSSADQKAKQQTKQQVLDKAKVGAEKSTEGKKPQSSADQKAKQQTKQQVLDKVKVGAEKPTEGKKPQSSADQKAKQQTKQQVLDKAKVGAEKSTEGKKPQSSADQKAKQQTKQQASNKIEEVKTKTKEIKEQATETSSGSKIENAKLEDTVKKQGNSIKLEGLFAFKMSMTAFYNEKGERVPVTALKYEPCRVSQMKSRKKESYEAVQVAFKAQKNKRCSKALIGHLKPSNFKEGARFVKEIRQTVPEGIKLGQELSIESLKKGDLVKISARSKGRGFSGVMKRWNFAGGKASHGSKSHRRIGSIGQHTEPARVFPGRKMPGQYGFKKISCLKVPVVEVLPEEGIIFVKGPVPGARNTLVSIRKMSNLSV